MKDVIRVFICDDIDEICIFFKNIIDGAEDMEVVGMASSGGEAVKGIGETQPDIVLMDIQMESKTAGIEAVKKVCENDPALKVIMLTVHDDDELIVQSYLAGAVDYLTKFAKPEFILEEIRKIYSEEILIGSTIAKHIRDEFIKTKRMQASLLYTITKWSTITGTERDIIQLISEGKSRREIADIKCVELSTVKTHINNILKKLEYSNMKSLIESLREIGIMDYLINSKKNGE